MIGDHTTPMSWLVHCYDGNNYFPAVIDNVTADEIGNHLVLTTDHTGIEFNMVVALPHDPATADQIVVLHDGEFLTVAQIKERQPEV